MAGFLAIILFAFLIFVVVIVTILGLGIGIGYLLRWGWPVIDLGTGILIGVVAAGVSLHYFFRVLKFLELLPTPIDPSLIQSDENEEEDDEEEDEPLIIYQRPQKRWRGRRRRRR